MPNYFQMKPFSGFSFTIGLNFWTQAVYMVVLPVFFMAYSIVYNPFDIQKFYSAGVTGFGFDLVMIACIILLTVGITRTVLLFLNRKYSFKRWQYISWCLIELFFMSAFTGLYSIFVNGTGESYLDILTRSMRDLYLILVHPYLFIFMARTIISKEKEMEIKETPADNDLIRFYDEHKRLKLTIAPSSVLFIRSEFNYVNINYLESGKVRSYQLRCSMKSIEGSVGNHRLVRCQRSYFINPEHISVLRKDKDGFIFADLNIPDLPSIPVSKTYYDSLSALL